MSIIFWHKFQYTLFLQSGALVIFFHTVFWILIFQGKKVFKVTSGVRSYILLQFINLVLYKVYGLPEAEGAV